MTYCCGLLLRDGLVMIADTRTNAGVDNVSVFRKLSLFQAEDRVLALATAGNLSVTQSALSELADGAVNPGTGQVETLQTAPTMFRAAQLLGSAIARTRKDIAAEIEPQVDAGVSLLFAGQIRGGPMRFFLIYGEGNFIECTADMPFFQIGESKYGKPILIRSITYDSDLYDALKIGLLSFESTIRSNLAVGLPLDLVVLRRDALEPELVHRIEADDVYFRELGDRWSEALRTAVADIPPPPYGPGGVALRTREPGGDGGADLAVDAPPGDGAAGGEQ